MFRQNIYFRVAAGLITFASWAILGAGISVGQPANGSSADKQSDGRFTGIAMITDDLKWYQLFSRPEAPRISGADHLAAGSRGALALVFSNAEPRDGTVKVICDVATFDPDGSQVIVNSGLCYEGPYFGPNVLHPVQMDLTFGIASDEPEGKAGFKVKLRDAHSGRKVNLLVTFIQGGTK
jgi:hypothetical protein